MSDYWFKPKTHGYGATPANWKGWAATVAYGLVVLVPTLPLIVWPATEQTGPTAWQVALWLACLGLLTWGFIRFCRARTDGEWRWRWGKD